MTRVKSVTSLRLILGFLGLSVVAALAGSVYWESLTLSGTLFWSTNMNPVRGVGGSVRWGGGRRAGSEGR